MMCGNHFRTILFLINCQSLITLHSKTKTTSEMTKFVSLLLLCPALLASFNATASTIQPVAIPMEELPTDNNDNDDEGIIHRRRIPSCPIMLTIDFDTQSITIASGVNSSEITSYEIRNSDEVPLFITYEETDFVTTLSNLPSGEYQILLTLPTTSLSGYFSLD